MLSRLFYLWEQNLARKDTNRKVGAFDWGTEFVSDAPPAGDSRLFMLDYASRAVADSDVYLSYQPPADWKLEGRHLTFTTPLKTNYQKNNTVHGWYYPADSRGRAVLVVPQWNSDAQSHKSLCRMLNVFGLSALRLSLPYHDMRMPDELERADYMLSPNLGRTLQAVRQAVIDSRTALDWLETQGYTRLAILGTSIGSCVAFITIAHDPRLVLSVQNHVSPYFADVVWEGLSTRHVREGLDGKIELEDLRRIWMPISPKAYMEKISATGKHSLLIHALYDFSFPPYLSQELLRDYHRFNIPHTAFALPCGHYTSGVFPFNIVLGYAMCRYIRRNL